MAVATAAATRTDEQIQQDVLAELKWDAARPAQRDRRGRQGRRRHAHGLGRLLHQALGGRGGGPPGARREGRGQRHRGAAAQLRRAHRTPTSRRPPSGRWSRDAFVPVDKLDVTVSKGWVTLKGEVEWQYQKEDAERVVRRLTGRQGRVQPHHGQAATVAVGAQGEDRAGAGAQRPDRRAADHRRGAGQQGHPEGHGALLGREGKRRSGRRGRRRGSPRSRTGSRSRARERSPSTASESQTPKGGWTHEDTVDVASLAGDAALAAGDGAPVRRRHPGLALAADRRVSADQPDARRQGHHARGALPGRGPLEPRHQPSSATP